MNYVKNLKEKALKELKSEKCKKKTHISIKEKCYLKTN